jgi:hypothetical protein
VLARVLKIGIRVFPSVFECSRVLKIAIDAHEIICLPSLRVTVTAEVASSSLVVPAMNILHREFMEVARSKASDRCFRKALSDQRLFYFYFHQKHFWRCPLHPKKKICANNNASGVGGIGEIHNFKKDGF